MGSIQENLRKKLGKHSDRILRRNSGKISIKHQRTNIGKFSEITPVKMTGRNSEIYSDRNPEMNCGYNLLEKSRNKIQEEMFQQYMDNLLQKFFEKKNMP